MKKSRIKIITIVFTIICFFTVWSNNLYAEATIEAVESGMSKVGTMPVSANSGSISNIINTIIGLLQVAGTGISVIVVSLLGIKYVLASVEQKAEIKKQATPIVIGCVLLFGAVNLMGAAAEFAGSLFGTQ